MSFRDRADEMIDAACASDSDWTMIRKIAARHGIEITDMDTVCERLAHKGLTLSDVYRACS